MHTYLYYVYILVHIYIYVRVGLNILKSRSTFFSLFQSGRPDFAEHPDRLQQLTFACTQLSGALPLDAQRLQHTCLMQSHLQCARLEATKMSMLLAS